jgi:hypothetical protein
MSDTKHDKNNNAHRNRHRLAIGIWAVADIYGGVQILISRLSTYLQKNSIDFTIIIKKDTRIAKELNWAKQIDLRELNETKQHFSHVFFPHVASLREDLPWKSISNSLVSCWLVHPTEIFTSFYPRTDRLLLWFGCRFAKVIQILLRNHTRSTSDLMQRLIAGNALFVMDGATERGLHYFYPGLSGPCNTIPLPIELGEVPDYSKRKRSNSAVLSVGYLGRLDEFKLSALRPFILHSLGRLTNEWKIELHLVSEGDCIAQIRNLCSNKGIVLHEHGFMPNASAKSLLVQKTDFVAAMGTAALDIASAGHPAIIIDPAHYRNSRPQEKFVFLHEISEFTVGEFRDCKHYRKGKHSIEQVVNQVQNDRLLGERGLNYVRKFHAPEHVFNQLMKQIIESNLQAGEIENKVFALKNSYQKIARTTSLILKMIGRQ